MKHLKDPVKVSALAALLVSLVWLVVMFIPGTFYAHVYVHPNELRFQPHNYFTAFLASYTTSYLVIGVCMTSIIMELRTLFTGKTYWGTILLTNVYALHISMLLSVLNPGNGLPALRFMPPTVIALHMVIVLVGMIFKRKAACK